MNSETTSINSPQEYSGQAEQVKICQNCRQDFTIEPADFDFYKKIDVPPPTWCPWCRMQRRMASAADSITLYKRTCQAPGHSERIVSVYPETTKAPVYDPQFWASDGWDAASYGREYDFSRSFFEQYKELLDLVPTRSTEVINCVNSDYSLGATDSKSCYWCSGTFGSENCLYGHTAVFSKDSVDVTISTAVEQCYDLYSVDKSFQTTSSAFSDELVNCDFMYDSRGCSDCLGCVGLRNKQYCLFNQQLSKKEYLRERARYDLGSYQIREEVRQRFEQLLLMYPRKYAVIRNTSNSTGHNLINIKNSRFVFEALNDVEDSAYCWVLGYRAKDCHDVGGAGLKSELLYDSVSVTSSSLIGFSYRVRNSRNVWYSRECFDSDYLFGCAGLKSKKYCILNKQYDKATYDELVVRIKKQMQDVPYCDSVGRTYGYGESMPPEHSFVPYNSSWAHHYFPEDEASALKRGFRWYTAPVREHAVTREAHDIPDNCKEVDSGITSDIIRCSRVGSRPDCLAAFKITTAEFQIYKKLNVALPRLCPVCRFNDHLRFVLPYKLWHRQCECTGVKQRTGYENTRTHVHGGERCLNEFETAYQPGRPELLYCEGCYNAEIL